MTKQRRGAALRLLLSIILMGLLLTQIDTENLLTEFQKVNPALYALGLLIFIGSLVAWTLRWSILLYDTGEQVSFRVVFTTLLIGLFLSLFLPSVVGMDAGRMHELSRMRENKIGVVSTVLLDRLIGLVSLVLTALLALLLVGYQFVTLEIALVIVGLTIALPVLWVLFFNRRFMQFFQWTLRLP
ncbi:MAG: lysylphosphatidylglycerol synthase transmembrane domain-containing protein, partial [Aggregatilineales bacterium]